MGKLTGIEVSIACSEAVTLCDVDVVAAYPITPQTHIVEHLSEQVAEGHLDAEYIKVESEHSAMSCCVGSSAAGARTFTSTCSQGLALMHEIVMIASGLRLPIVMAVATRTLSAPLSIWGDQSDVMSERDSGWITIFAENGQEVFDLTVQSFRIAEDERVLFPVMLCLDGFHLSHVIEPIEIESKEDVQAWLPPYQAKYRLDPDNVLSMGAFAMPDYFSEIKKQTNEALMGTLPVIKEVFKDFGDKFGRYYEPVTKYQTEDAETIIVIAGAFAGTARLAVDTMRAAGQKVGLVTIKVFRPFPFEEIAEALAGAKTAVVIDRALSVAGPGGPMASEIRSALYHAPKKPAVVSMVGGLSGRDVFQEQFIELVERAEAHVASGKIPHYEMFGVRE